MLEKKVDAAGATKILNAFHKMDSVLGFLESEKEIDDPKVQELINARNRARSEQNWVLADRLREQLRSLGIIVQDRKV